jgi:DNA polymerase-3 subunit alpha
MNILKMMPLKDAKKTKVKVQKEEKHTPEPLQPPLILALNLMPDAKTVEDLMRLVEKYPGKRPLELHIKSKLADVIIESKMKVSEMIMEEAKALGVYLEETLNIEG